MFWTIPVSIIRSFSLYTQQWYMSYRFADSLRAGSGRNCSSVVILMPYIDVIKNQLDTLISQIYVWNKTLYVSDSSSVHYHEFFTVHTAVVYVILVCWQIASRIRTDQGPSWSCSQAVSKPVWHIPFLCVQWGKPPMMDRGTVQNT